MILGIALLITFAISIVAIVQKNHVTIGLVVLNYALLVDAIGIVIIGTFVWFFTLGERANFHVLWLGASREARITLQDQVCIISFLSRATNNICCSSNVVDISMDLTELRSGVHFARPRTSSQR